MNGQWSLAQSFILQRRLDYIGTILRERILACSEWQIEFGTTLHFAELLDHKQARLKRNIHTYN